MGFSWQRSSGRSVRVGGGTGSERTLTHPTNALSILRLLSASPDGTNVTVTWQSVAGVSYVLECSTNLAPTPCFTPLATNLLGQPGTTTYTDTNAVGAGPFFYRVGVGD